MAINPQQVSSPVRKYSRYSPQNIPRQELLRKAVLENTPYTDQARAAMQNVPIKMYGAPNTNYPEENAGGYYNERDGININVKYPFPQQVDVLRHEFIHSQDANVNGHDPISYIPKPGFYVDSDGFYQRIPTKTDQRFVRRNTDTPLYADNNKEDLQNTRDTEGMAYIGMGGALPMQNPAYYQEYKNLYNPISLAPKSLLASRTPNKNVAGASIFARLLSSSAIQRELKRDPKMVNDIVAAIKQLSLVNKK